MDAVRQPLVELHEAEQAEEARTRRALLHMLEDLQRERQGLRSARHDWLRTVDALGDPLLVHDAALRVVRCNRAYAARAGMDFTQILGRPYWQCFPKGPGPLAACHQSLEVGAADVHETEFQIDTGEIFVSRAYAVGADEALQVLHLFENVTDKRRVQATLAESKQRLILATQSAGIAIWDWDVVANKLVWDARMYELYGIREHDFSGAYEAWRSGLHPEDRESAHAAVAAALEGIKDFHHEFRIVWPDGDVRHIEGHAIVIRTDQGVPARMIGVNWDITERTRAAQRQIFTNAVLTAQQETSLDAIYVVDDNRAMVSWNRRFTEMWGVSDEIMQSRSDDLAIKAVLDNFVSPDDFLDGVRQLYESKELRINDELRLKDGRFINRFSSPMMGTDDRYYGRIFYFRDVTAKRVAEQALRDSEAKFHAIFDHSLDGILVMDREARSVRFANISMERLLGYGPGQLADMPLSRLFPPEAEQVFQQLGEETGGGASNYVQDVAIQRCDGQLVYADISASLVSIEQRPSLLAAFRDATGRRAGEQKLRANLDELLRWQGLNLDREDRVLELKREVNDLLARLKEAPRYESAS